MGLKEQFLMYCEYQKVADDALRANTANENTVIEAFEKANSMKKSLMDKLEAVDENSNFKWYPLWYS